VGGKTPERERAGEEEKSLSGGGYAILFSTAFCIFFGGDADLPRQFLENLDG